MYYSWFARIWPPATNMTSRPPVKTRTRKFSYSVLGYVHPIKKKKKGKKILK
jgi:hypothetical protein